MLWLLACHPVPPPPPQEAVQSELSLDGPLRERVSRSAAELVIYYGGERKGSMETCGCPNRPRGSLARAKSYIDVSQRDGTPSIQLDTGYFLEDATSFEGGYRPDIVLLNRWMVQGLAALGVDAVNVGSIDLAGLKGLGDAPELAGLPMVSAQVSGSDRVLPYRIVERGGRKIGITGISGVVPTLGEPIVPLGAESLSVVRENIEKLATEVDVVVVMAWHATELAKKVVSAIPEVDLVIDASQYRDYAPAVVVGHALWVYSHYETMRLGELRLTFSAESPGQIVSALDRKIDLDPQVPDDPELLRMQHSARFEANKLQSAP